ncbi:unnamed protein product [Allacma fusca]|uniref:Uncharacterized protein n=1 Tax=Allacma fusca TaxID=39272 RepID=A0A8J2NWI3_9HEXA|nr:unnamed protein product [Allacma fusca]
MNWSGFEEELANLTPDKVRQFVDDCVAENPSYEDRCGWCFDQFVNLWQLQRRQKYHNIEVAGNEGGNKSANKTFRIRVQRFRQGLQRPCLDGLPPAKEERAAMVAEMAAWDHVLDPNFWRARVRICFGVPDLAERGQVGTYPTPPKNNPPAPKKAARKVEAIAGPAEALDPRAIIPPIPLDNIQIRFTQPTKKFYVGHLPQREVAALPGRQVTEVPLQTPVAPGVPDLRIRTGGPANLRSRQCH